MMDIFRRFLAFGAVVYLSMLIGAVIVIFDIFPADHFVRGAKGGYALYTIAKNQLEASSGRPSEFSWYPALHDAKGLTKYDKE